MRPPSDMPGRRRRLRFPAGRRRAALVVVLVAGFVLVTSLRTIADFYTDYLWFESLDLTSVWRGVLGTKVLLVAVFTLVFFALMWTNLLVAERLSGRTLRFGGSSEDELVLKYRELVGRRAALVRSSTAGLIALAAGGGAATQWNNWILLRNHVEFGERDATFGHDIGFYVFQLPFLRFVVGWVFSALVVVTVVTVVAHYLNGGIRLQATQDRVGPAVKAHVSVLLAALAAIRGGQYWLDRYELVYSRRGAVDGAGYTDVNVQLRAIDLLVLIAVFATILFLVNIRRRGWVLPVMAVGIWGLVAILAGEAVPALVQRFRVDGERSALEAPYVENNITATRSAMGLDQIEEQDFASDPDLSGQDLMSNADTVRNIRLWDPGPSQRDFRFDQALRRYYDIPDVDVDRYTVDGETRQVMVAPRSIDEGELPPGSSGWEQSRLVYTYGYGVVMAPSNATSTQGAPVYAVGEIPSESDDGFPAVEEPRMYFGEGLSGYKIVDTDRAELDVGADTEAGETGGDADAAPGYTGTDGVPLDGILRRAAFALRFGEVEPLTSGSIRSGSRVLMERDVRGRVQSLAPFLALDADPYPVVDDDGRILYVIDAYTTTDRYPNAEHSTYDEDLVDRSGLRGRSFNYARNSVKAVVDAYDGTVTLYVTDDEDPLVRAYRRAFPDLFEDVADAPAGLVAHFRYPEDLFRVQTGYWGRYHITEADAFLTNDGARWSVAGAGGPSDSTPATTTPSSASSTPAEPVEDARDSQDRIEPTYQQIQLPGEEEPDFVLVRPFTVQGRVQLSAFLTADPTGRLVSFEVPAGETGGPEAALNAIQAKEDVNALRQQNRERLSFGNVLLVPIADSVLYVQSVYVASADQVPRIRAVIVADPQENGSIRVEVDVTLRDALVKMFGTAPDTLEVAPDISFEDLVEGEVPAGEEPAVGEDPPDEEPPDDEYEGTDAELIAAIQAEFARAEEELAAGDLAGYQDGIEEAERLFAILAARREVPDDEEGATGTTTPSDVGGGGGPSPTTTTTPEGPADPPASTTPSTTTTTAPASTTTTTPADPDTSTTTRPSA